MTIPSSGSNDLRLKVGYVGRLRGVDPIAEACATKSISGAPRCCNPVHVVELFAAASDLRRFMPPYPLLSMSTI
ncbi:hypothetical protein FHT82_000686 [Rhizobium sp. BK275]|uniref:hypothetical protein n=1 Tax=unclassified Rhizobium TaxID=2613769 RepID=UPI0016117EC3|nr:hypothetical protein [Rhizobium sp. BK275]MBB3407315.1 hypothetical protein [Rhizobium sp. BK316]